MNRRARIRWGVVPIAVLALAAASALQPSKAGAQAACQPPKQLGVVFVLDDSGSMTGNDPQKLRGTMTDLGLRQLGPGRIAAGVTFATNATTVFGPTALDDQNIAGLSGQMSGALKSSGSTDYQKAFTAALAQLQAMPPTVDRKAVIFLSDGQPNGPFEADRHIAGVPIYTVGFGEAPPAVLKDIAYRSGAQSFAAPDAGAAQAVAARIIGALTCQPVDEPEVVVIPPGGSRDVTFDVPKGTKQFTALATWSQGGQVSGRLVRPDNGILGPGTVKAGETFGEGGTFMRATSVNPATGKWKVRLSVSGASPESVNVTIDVLGGGDIDGGLNKRPKPDGPGCETEVRINDRVAWSTCFKRIRGGWSTRKPMRINGIDLEARHRDVKLMRNGVLRADDALVSVRSNGPLFLNGKLPLYRGEVRLPLRGAQLLKLKGEGSNPIGKIGGLPIVPGGDAELAWTDKGAELKVSLSFGSDIVSLLEPKPGPGKTLQRGFGLDVKLSTSNDRGVAFDRIGGYLDSGKIFNALALKRLSLSYDFKEHLWVGGATVVPFEGPLARFKLPEVSAEVGIKVDPVEFGHLKVTVSDINKPMGPYLFLQKIGGSVTRIPPPFTISGELGLSLGPKIDVPGVGELSLVELDATASYSWPATIKATSGVKVLSQTVGNASLELNASEPSASYVGDTALTVAGTGLAGRLDGWIKGGEGQLYGSVSMEVFDKTVTGGEGFINTRGMGGCRRGWGPDYGFTIDFRRDLPGAVNLMAHSCDFGDLLFSTRPSAAQGGQAFEVARGATGMLLRVRGTGGQPAVAVTGPGGARFEIPGTVPMVETPQYFAIRDEANRDLWIVLNAPAAGAWSVQPLAGSAPLQPLGTARALPKPNLKVSVRRASRGRRVLRWRARRNKGQRIAFVERGPGGIAREVLTTSRSKGSKRFRPAIGRGGTRTIEATVLQNGLPRVASKAARFRTSARKPSRPRRVRVRQRGSRVVVRWSRAPGAVGYVVTGRLRDGRRIEEWVGRRTRRLVLRSMPRRTRGRFAVRSVAKAGVRSARAQATLKRRRR